jgi:hypothetical protein
LNSILWTIEVKVKCIEVTAAAQEVGEYDRMALRKANSTDPEGVQQVSPGREKLTNGWQKLLWSAATRRRFGANRKLKDGLRCAGSRPGAKSGASALQSKAASRPKTTLPVNRCALSRAQHIRPEVGTSHCKVPGSGAV